MNSNDGILTAEQVTSTEAGISPPTRVVPPGPRESNEDRKPPRRKRLTAETRTCYERLRALAAPLRLRISYDDEGWPFIPGKYGRIECVDAERQSLAVCCARPRAFRRLRAIHDLYPDQQGDREMHAIFPAERFDEVVRVIRAYRKPGLTSEQARAIGSRTRFRAGSRTALQGAFSGAEDAIGGGGHT